MDQQWLAARTPQQLDYDAYKTAVVKGVANDTKSVKCAQEALGKNGVSLTLDAAGFIPGEGFAAAGVQTGVATASALNSASHGDKFGTYAGITGMELALPGAAMKSAGVSAAKAVPFVGTGVNALATLHDLGSANKDYKACMSRP
jgi:hypothetical protein